MRPAYLPAALSLALGSPLRWRSRSRPARRFGAALPLAPGSPLRCGALAPLGSPPCAALSLTLGSPLRRGGFRRRKRLFVRLFGAALSLRPVRRPLFRRRSRSARLAALWRRSRSRPARRPLFRRGGFRRRKRLFVRPFRRRSRSARFAALCLRRRSRSARLAAFCFSGAFLRRPRPKAVKKIKKISDRYFIFS